MFLLQAVFQCMQNLERNLHAQCLAKKNIFCLKRLDQTHTKKLQILKLYQVARSWALSVHNNKGAKAPQSAAQRKAKQRAGLEAKGLVMVIFPETWVKLDKALEIRSETEKLIDRILGKQNAN